MTPGPAAVRELLVRHATAAGVAVLAVIAYGPALLSSPGRMPADTKLYLYLDPGGLLGRATSTFEPDQFAGWVPHQQITYLWPSGPWFWLFDTMGVPDWVAHRLWIGSIMFLAGWGVHWTARRLGLGGGAALAAALVYQTSPFLLPYISRTSLLLLPWAGLGWIVGLTVRATARARVGRPAAEAPNPFAARLSPWREPALIALVVATVGSPNATALALIAPAPILWLVHAAWARLVPWRAAAAIAARTGVLCVVVSLWWVAMLVVQSRHGAPVLAYSETLGDVSRNSTGSEVLRGLGYWLFYVRDPFAPTTSASLEYLAGTRVIAVSYAVSLVGLLGLAVTTSPFRRFAALLVAVGAVLAVGVHPIGSSSPLMSVLAADDGSGIALALRSSTRALPLLVLGLALGAGSLVAAVPRRRQADGSSLMGRSTLVAGAVGLLAIANLPALWQFELVDPAIDRDQQPPAAWVEAAGALDPDGGRVLQLPGAEFGAFRWGYTVDQPLVALTARPVVTRDLLPLGSAPAMDLLYALDDRIQEGTIEPAAVAPVARLLASDTIWLANDLEFERFRTPWPGVVNDVLTAPAVAAGGSVSSFGEPAVAVPVVAMIEPAALADDRVARPLAPVTLVELADPVDVVRVKTDSVILAGSGDGIVDAAAAGLLSGHELVLYGAALDGEDVAARLADGTPLVVTDANRDRAHHWRGSQDVHGHTEPGGADDDVLTPTAADQRLDVFGTDDPDVQTIAIQVGPVRAVASAYGEPFAYLPEHRAVHAIDGDPSTAWTVGEHGAPVGERIVLQLTEPAASVRVHQPAPAPGGRRIDGVRITVDGDSFDVGLGDESTGSAGQLIELGASAPGTVGVEITSVTAGDPATAASRAGVGFAELDFGLPPTTEWIRPPAAALAASGDAPLGIVLTRLRVDPLDRWRADPEPALAREITLPAPRTFTAEVTLRLDRRTDDDTLYGLVTGEGEAAVTADRRLTGAPRHGGAAALDGDPATAWTTPIDDALGATLVFRTAEPVGPLIDLTQPTGDHSAITMLQLSDGRSTIDVPVPPPDAAGTSRLELPAAVGPGVLTLTITGTDGASTVDRRFGDRVALPAAIAELSAPGLPSSRLADDDVVEHTCEPGLLELDGRPVPLSFRTTVGELLDGEPIEATPCDGALALAEGTHRLRSTGGSSTGMTVDRVVLTDGLAPPAPPSSIVATVSSDGARARQVVVPGCPAGCWLVDGHGHNDAWAARIAGDSLGPPTMVDGGFNGWWLPPATGPVTVDITWTAQTPVDVGLVLSLLAVLACLAVAGLTRGHTPALDLATSPTDRPSSTDPARAAVRSGAALVGASLLLIGPVWGAIALVPAAAGVALAGRTGSHRTAWLTGRVLELVGLAAAAGVALAVVAVVRRDRPLPTAGWTAAVDHLNGLALFAVLCIAAGSLRSTGARAAGGRR